MVQTNPGIIKRSDKGFQRKVTSLGEEVTQNTYVPSINGTAGMDRQLPTEVKDTYKISDEDSTTEKDGVEKSEHLDTELPEGLEDRSATNGLSNREPSKSKAIIRLHTVENRYEVKMEEDQSCWFRYYHVDEWLPAVFHSDIREDLLKDAQAKGQYVYKPEQGNDPVDITSFLEDHREWGPLRKDRPKILFQLEAPKPRVDPEYQLDILTHQGRIVLNWGWQPITDFRELPHTISSQVEGWRMEAILRMHSRITLSDILSRMVYKPGHKVPFVSPSCLSMRMDRWRRICRCIQWNRQGKDESLKQYILNLMTPEMKRRNDTEGLEDIIQGSGERDKIELINFGSKPGKKKAEIPDRLRGHEKTRLQKRADIWDKSLALQKKVKIQDQSQVDTAAGSSSTNPEGPGTGDAHDTASTANSSQSAQVLQDDDVHPTGSIAPTKR